MSGSKYLEELNDYLEVLLVPIADLVGGLVHADARLEEGVFEPVENAAELARELEPDLDPLAPDEVKEDVFQLAVGGFLRKVGYHLCEEFHAGRSDMDILIIDHFVYLSVRFSKEPYRESYFPALPWE